MMRYFLIGFVLFLSTLAVAQPPKIGYVDIQMLINHSASYEQAQQDLIKTFKPEEQKLQLLDQQLRKVSDKFTKDKATLSDTEQKTQIEKITQLEQQFKQKLAATKERLEIQKKQNIDSISKHIHKIVKTIAATEKFDLILYREPLFVSKNIDITERIARKLDALEAKSNIKFKQEE